jgi:hypothetical protein
MMKTNMRIRPILTLLSLSFLGFLHASDSESDPEWGSVSESFDSAVASLELSTFFSFGPMVQFSLMNAIRINASKVEENTKALILKEGYRGLFFYCLKDFCLLSELNFDDRQFKKVIQFLSKTEKLTIHNYPISNEGLNNLKDLPELRSLEIGMASKITDKGLETIIQLKKLTSLSLIMCFSITDVGLNCI